jgi:hypothetical protein
MTKLTVVPRNKKELATVKKVLELLNVKFMPVEESPYDPEFVEKIKKAEKRGEFKTINPKDVGGSLGLK